MSNKFFLKIINQTNRINTGTVFFFHGTAGSGSGIVSWINSLVDDFSLPHIKFIFPTAPLRRYTAYNGQQTNVWFDRFAISPDAPDHKETINSIGKDITILIQKEIDSGVPLKHIIIGGYSMGACLALHTAYRFVPGSAGVFAISGFLNNNSDVYTKLKESSTILAPLLMCHGEDDGLVPIEWAQNTFNILIKLKVQGEFVSFKNNDHSLDKQALEKVLDWVLKILPE